MSADRWNAYWFGDREGLLLSVYRVLIGAAVLVEATRYLLHFEEITRNVIPVAVMLPWKGDFAVWLSAQGGPNLILLFVSALLVTVGLFTPVALPLLCLAFRMNMFYLSPFSDASSMLCFVNLFLLCFTDANRHFSLDRRFFGPRAARRRWSLPTGMVKRLMQWNFILIFVTTGLHKATNPDWMNGKVMVTLFSQASWSRGTVLNEVVRGNMWLGFTAGVLVVAFEIAFVLAATKRLRSFFAVCGILGHFTIAALTTVPFPFLLFFVPAYLLLYDSRDLENLWHILGRWLDREGRAPGRSAAPGLEKSILSRDDGRAGTSS